MAFVFAVAYGVKALSEFLSQTFDSKPYERRFFLCAGTRRQAEAFPEAGA